MSAPLTITQFSDTHFSRPGNRSHGGFGYDTDAAWAAAFADAYLDNDSTDLTVVTGDLADHGEPDEYAVAARHLAQIPHPTNVLPGNHDFHLPLQVGVPRPGLTMDRVQRVGSWLFVFADSNGDGRERDAIGRLIDKPDRIASNGRLGLAEVAWIDAVVDASDAPNVWLWMHHPPAMAGSFAQPALDAEVAELINAQPHIKGIGAGHVHTDLVATIEGLPVYVCPALTIGFDMQKRTTLPPGYRRYSFADDGSVDSNAVLLDDDRWPRFDLPEVVVRHFAGEVTWEDMVAELGPLAQ